VLLFSNSTRECAGRFAHFLPSEVLDAGTRDLGAFASLSTLDEFDRQEALGVLTDAYAVFKKAAPTL